MTVATQATDASGSSAASKRDSDKELADLVPLAVDGSRRALQRIMRIIHPQVLRYCRARIGGHRQPTAEDVAQEICLAVATSIGTYKDKGRPFMAYVYGIAAHKVTDAHRALSRDQTHPTDDVPEDAAEDATPEESALVMDGSNRVRAMLDTLSDKARDIIILRVFVGLSAEETAEIVESTPGAVRVAQHRALAQLRKSLDSHETL
ncbi:MULTISPECIES: sigma-70 family RNA polymerase sigma factor [unclassified Corynebacterium]|uniref:sigma-70 family RNA polymerase sigma factor n=1 Tax=unclassified Corynebacterium TaxID=2624378 RepID=UPI0008A2A9D1|nr:MULTISPECIES: sigma-70 family RNA polymerase sigma factor [unclassified Corynebacterium]OFK67099.1 RNA polymerase subunit sigma [Corynebacterium sp. HMSC076G08]OFP29653.1 RNA polymerase subunit sigma [Corynebacterium sp. HMSC068G04]OHO55300.1 RNA polymerase subunit sigma [Corynebacterium sp. HMSC035E02]